MEECNNAYANESSLSTQRVCYQASVGKVQVTSLNAIFFPHIFFELRFNQKEAEVMNCFNGQEWRK